MPKTEKPKMFKLEVRRHVVVGDVLKNDKTGEKIVVRASDLEENSGLVAGEWTFVDECFCVRADD